jgi:hypothetical protein
LLFPFIDIINIPFPVVFYIYVDIHSIIMYRQTLALALFIALGVVLVTGTIAVFGQSETGEENRDDEDGHYGCTKASGQSKSQGIFAGEGRCVQTNVD